MSSQVLEDILLWPKLVPAICIHCDNQAMIFRHKTLCIMVSLDTFIVDIIPFGSCYQMELSLLNLWRQKYNLVDLFTEGLS